MKFSRNAPAVIISAIVVTTSVLAVVSANLFSRQMASIESEQLAQVRSVVEFNLKGAEERAVARAEMIASLPRIQELFASRDREGLLKETERMFAIQKDKYGVDQAQFHLPPAISFLRLQAPDKFGDDLSSFRPMVVAVNQEKTSRRGLSIARTGPGIFGVVPMTDLQGKHNGSFEVGLQFGPILDKLKVAYGFEMTILLDEEVLRGAATSLGGDIFNDQNRVGKFVKFHSTHWNLMRKLVNVEDTSRVNGDQQYSRNAFGTDYGVVLSALRNSSGKALGIIAAAKNFDILRASTKRVMVLQATQTVMAIILLTGLVLVVIQGMLLRPLAAISTHFDALESGEEMEELPDSDKLCDELRTISRQYNRLREGAKETEE